MTHQIIPPRFKRYTVAFLITLSKPSQILTSNLTECTQFDLQHREQQQMTLHRKCLTFNCKYITDYLYAWVIEYLCLCATVDKKKNLIYS